MYTVVTDVSDDIFDHATHSFLVVRCGGTGATIVIECTQCEKVVASFHKYYTVRDIDHVTQQPVGDPRHTVLDPAEELTSVMDKLSSELEKEKP